MLRSLLLMLLRPAAYSKNNNNNNSNDDKNEGAMANVRFTNAEASLDEVMPFTKFNINVIN